MKIANVKPTLVLCTICLVVALLLSGVNTITGPIIEAAQNAAANEALLEVLPDGKNFEELSLTPDYPAIVTAGYKADGGFVFQMTRSSAPRSSPIRKLPAMPPRYSPTSKAKTVNIPAWICPALIPISFRARR